MDLQRFTYDDVTGCLFLLQLYYVCHMSVLLLQNRCGPSGIRGDLAGDFDMDSGENQA